MAEEARDPALDLDACVQERAEVVDALLADAFSKRPLFVGEADDAIQRITGRIFVGNEEYAHREAWAVARPRCTGARGRAWLTLRLWEKMAQEAAEAVAEGSPDRLLREAAGVSRRFAEGAKDGRLTPEWVEENAHALGVLPMFADAFRLLYLELPYLERFGTEAVVSRLCVRLELVATLRRLRDEYPEESGGWTATMLALLAGQSKGLMLKKKRFDPWWAERRESQATFDARFAAGLEAAAKEGWEEGATAFGDAAAAWPERACARHNGAVCLLRAGRSAEAEALLEALTAEEPDEPLYWLRLGDARRAAGKSREALAAYREAAKLGGLEQAASVRLGLALADEGRDDEARKELDAAAGPEPDADTLEGLADFLEQEGVFGLAHHYRQKALGERLSSEDDEDEDPPTQA
jgi:Tfp pilus assembly protein PilF